MTIVIGHSERILKENIDDLNPFDEVEFSNLGSVDDCFDGKSFSSSFLENSSRSSSACGSFGESKSHCSAFPAS